MQSYRINLNLIDNSISLLFVEAIKKIENIVVNHNIGNNILTFSPQMGIDSLQEMGVLMEVGNVSREFLPSNTFAKWEKDDEEETYEQ